MTQPGWPIGGCAPWRSASAGAAAYTRGDGRPPPRPRMERAHVREQNGPAGAPRRLAAAATGPGMDDPARWIDLEVARRRAIAADRNLAHDRGVHRPPRATLHRH